MGVQVIPIPTEVVSHSLPFPILCFIPIPMGFPWDSRSHWESHSHAHLYYAVVEVHAEEDDDDVYPGCLGYWPLKPVLLLFCSCCRCHGWESSVPLCIVESCRHCMLYKMSVCRVMVMFLVFISVRKNCLIKRQRKFRAFAASTAVVQCLVSSLKSILM